MTIKCNELINQSNIFFINVEIVINKIIQMYKIYLMYYLEMKE